MGHMAVMYWIVSNVMNGIVRNYKIHGLNLNSTHIITQARIMLFQTKFFIYGWMNMIII